MTPEPKDYNIDNAKSSKHINIDTTTNSELRAKVIEAVCFKPSITGHLEQFERIEALINKQIIEARIDELEWVKNDDIMQGVKIRYQIDDRLTQLRTTK